MTSLTVVLPLPINIANGRMHWRAKDVARGKYMECCRLAYHAQPSLQVMASMLKLYPAAGASLKFALHLGRQMDHDNALARCKWPVDFLVAQGLLQDDSPKHCAMSIPEQVVTRDKSKHRLEITIAYHEKEQLP